MLNGGGYFSVDAPLPPSEGMRQNGFHGGRAEMESQRGAVTTPGGGGDFRLRRDEDDDDDKRVCCHPDGLGRDINKEDGSVVAVIRN